MATVSCENKHTQAYSEDLRWHMVYQTKVVDKSYREIGESSNVDPSTVCRTIALFDETGGVSKRKYPENPGTQKVSEIVKLMILEFVLDKPGIYFRELQKLLVEESGTEVDVSTICRFLHESGFTRQKLILVAKQRRESLRAEYLMALQVYRGHPEPFVFVDETGSDRRDSLRRLAIV